jgi:hypothetical protein
MRRAIQSLSAASTVRAQPTGWTGWQIPALILFGMAVIFARNPDALFDPLIFAEDGVWAGIALTEGWTHVLLNARPDYLVIGNLLLLWLALQISSLFGSDPISWLPQSIALVSFGFYAGTATLCFATLRRAYNPWAGAAGFLWLLLLPIGHTQNEVLGRLLQIGFYMPLLVVMLLYWRDELAHRWARFGTDALIVLCAATNPVVFLVVAVYFLLDLLRERRLYPAIARNLSLGLPLVLLALFLAPRMGGHGGVEGVADPAKWIEAAVARALLYPLLFGFYEQLSDWLSLILLMPVLALIATALVSGNRRERQLLALTLCAVIIYTVATLTNRPGLTGHLQGYIYAMPVDRYFMGINALMVFLLTAACASLMNSPLAPGVRMLAVTMALLYAFRADLLFEPSPRHQLGHGHSFQELMCFAEPVPNHPQRSAIPIYPHPWSMTVPSELIDRSACQMTRFDQAGLFFDTADFGRQASLPLSPENDLTIRFWGGHRDTGADLVRIGVLLGTHGATRSGDANLILSSEPAEETLVPFDLSHLEDNRYAYFDVPPGVYQSARIHTQTGDLVSTWESITPDGVSNTCVIFEYRNHPKVFTPGCPAW